MDSKNYLKIEPFAKAVTIWTEVKNNNNTLIKNQQPKTVKGNSNNNNRNLVIGFSNSGKSYLMNFILHQKHATFFIITKSLNQYPNQYHSSNIRWIQSLKDYENSLVGVDDMLLSKQESNIDLFFTRGRQSNNDIYYISQSYFQLPKILFVKNISWNILYKRTLRDIILLF